VDSDGKPFRLKVTTFERNLRDPLHHDAGTPSRGYTR
jgi:hypothetical protein